MPWRSGVSGGKVDEIRGAQLVVFCFMLGAIIAINSGWRVNESWPLSNAAFRNER